MKRTLLTLALLGSLVASATPGRASVFDALIHFGDDMAPFLDDKSGREAPRSVTINGQQLHVAVGRTRQPPARVKDFYLDKYFGTTQTLAHIAAQLPGGKRAPATQFTFGNDDDGGMIALDLGAQALNGRALALRIKKFLRSQELGDLGAVRYVKWQREKDGGTRYLTMWTDKSFALDAVMPPPGRDVPGGDIANVPRLPGLTRVLALEEDGQPFRTRVYEGPGSVLGAASTLAYELRHSGWVEDEGYAKSQPGSAGLRFVRRGRTLIVGVDAATHAGTVDVALIEKRGAE